MRMIHYCKTKTCAEYDPSTHVHYKKSLDDLMKQKDTLDDARKQLLCRNLNVEYHQEQSAFTLALYKNIFGLYLCDVKVNNVACRFVIDTGAQLSSIRYGLMKQLKLQPLDGSIEIGSAVGTKKILKGCVLDSLSFGAAIYRQLPVLCLDKDDFSLPFGNIDMFHFDGILGWDILRNFDFEIDTISKQLKFMRNRYKFHYQNMVSGVFPIFLAEDQFGNLLKMGFDSGSMRSWLSNDSAKCFRYEKNGDLEAVGFGVHGIEHMHAEVYKKVDFRLFKACISIHNVMSGNCSILPDIEVNGVFGNEIFKNRRIRLINSKGIVLLA